MLVGCKKKKAITDFKPHQMISNKKPQTSCSLLAMTF